MTVSLQDLGAPVATGRSAQIYSWPTAPDRVVKLFPAGYPSALVEAEQAASQEAFRLGVTPLACDGRVEVGERSGLLLQRVNGESLNRLSEQHPMRLRAICRSLAQTHAALHAARTGTFRDVRKVAVECLETEPLAFLTDRQRAAAVRLVTGLPAGDRVLHMDFHPENVFTHDGGYAVIDWPTALQGAPAADVAASVLLLRDAELWPGTPVLQRITVTLVRPLVLSTYLREYCRLTGMCQDEIDRWRPVALILRMSTLDIASERSRFRRELATILDEV